MRRELFSLGSSSRLGTEAPNSQFLNTQLIAGKAAPQGLSKVSSIPHARALSQRLPETSTASPLYISAVPGLGSPHSFLCVSSLMPRPVLTESPKWGSSHVINKSQQRISGSVALLKADCIPLNNSPNPLQVIRAYPGSESAHN